MLQGVSQNNQIIQEENKDQTEKKLNNDNIERDSLNSTRTLSTFDRNSINSNQNLK